MLDDVPPSRGRQPNLLVFRITGLAHWSLKIIAELRRLSAQTKLIPLKGVLKRVPLV
jgi:hypothetical protein